MALTSLPVVGVYTLAGHELADKGGLADTPRAQHGDVVRGDLLGRRSLSFLLLAVLLLGGRQGIRSRSPPPEGVPSIDDTCRTRSDHVRTYTSHHRIYKLNSSF